MTGVPAKLPVYLDHHATTPMDPRVIEAMAAAMRDLFGNPNSVEHAIGRQAAAAIMAAQSQLAKFTGCEPEHVFFTASASDAIRKALELATVGAGMISVAAMRVEHPATIAALNALAQDGRIETTWLDVDARGQLEVESLHRALRKGLDLVCIMMANNEVGTIYPIAEVLSACREAGARTMIDATQAAGRLDLSSLGTLADFVVLSGHKIYGPKGIGALIVPDAAPDVLRLFSHAGTPNVAAIVGFGVAADVARTELDQERSTTARLRNRLQEGLSSALETLNVNGDTEHRLPHSLHISIPGIPNDAVLARIGHEVAISTGAACASGAQEPSHVLRAMNLPEPLVDSALRLSVGRFTTDVDVDFAVEAIVRAVCAIQGAQEEKIAC